MRKEAEEFRKFAIFTAHDIAKLAELEGLASQIEAAATEEI